MLFIAAGAILSLTAAVLCLHGHGVMLFNLEKKEHRTLRLSQFYRVGSSMAKSNLKTTLHVYLTGHKPNHAYSIFQTDIMQRYGSGRFDYKIHDGGDCDASTSCGSHAVVEDSHEPCLAVSRTGRLACTSQQLSCRYPGCKTMVTNDETCSLAEWYDVREYYTATHPGKGYLPLGPRADSWASFQKLQGNPKFRIKQASKRKYAFNAIFSRSTNGARSKLAGIIDQNRDESSLKIYTVMAEKWASDVNNPLTAQLDTNSYIRVALDSIFTLSPAGHNPECFRLFEAVEAGSIPVITESDLYHSPALCKEALRHWHDAPIVVLESWDSIFAEIEALMADEEKLNEMQVNLRMWYDDYLREIVGGFEDFMIESYLKDHSVAGKAVTATK